jgi:hypothetical protein
VENYDNINIITLKIIKHYHITMMVEEPTIDCIPGALDPKLNPVLLHPGGGKS